MATRRRKSGQFKRQTSRRRSKPKTNLTNIAVSGLVANAITTNVFGANLMDFFTGNRDGVYRAGSDGSMRLTLPELFGAGKISAGGNYSAGWDLQSVIMKNIKDNWVQLGMGVILIPVAAKTVTKLIRKPVILPVNRILKSINLDVKV
jgi:hypothetical protein